MALNVAFELFLVFRYWRSLNIWRICYWEGSHALWIELAPITHMSCPQLDSSKLFQRILIVFRGRPLRQQGDARCGNLFIRLTVNINAFCAVGPACLITFSHLIHLHVSMFWICCIWPIVTGFCFELSRLLDGTQLFWMPWKALSNLRLISQAKRYLLPLRLMDWRTALILRAKIALPLLTHSAHSCCQLILSIWVNAILALRCLLLLPLVQLLTQLMIYLLRSRIQLFQLSSLCFHHWLPLHFWLLV